MMKLGIGISQLHTKSFPTGLAGKRFGFMTLTLYEAATHVRRPIHRNRTGRMGVFQLANCFVLGRLILEDR